MVFTLCHSRHVGGRKQEISQTENNIQRKSTIEWSRDVFVYLLLVFFFYLAIDGTKVGIATQRACRRHVGFLLLSHPLSSITISYQFDWMKEMFVKFTSIASLIIPFTGTHKPNKLTCSRDPSSVEKSTAPASKRSWVRIPLKIREIFQVHIRDNRWDFLASVWIISSIQLCVDHFFNSIWLNLGEPYLYETPALMCERKCSESRVCFVWDQIEAIHST